MDKQSGTILRIEKTSIHDGPGLRTVIFFKGCPLNCKWCSTPESQDFKPEKGYIENRCVGCFRCVETCKQNAITLIDGKINTDHKKCINCFSCIDKCPKNAYKKYGEIMTLAQVMNEISKDELFFFHSGGGVTLSGGEILAQPDFAEAILKESRNLGINTAIETSFYSEYENIKKLLPYINILYVDIKHMDSNKHKKLTGVDNALILENIKKTSESNFEGKIYIRIPLIPTINDDDKNLSDVVNFCNGMKKLEYVELLPYHRLGLDTYKYIGKKYELKNYKSPSDEHMLERVKFMSGLSSDVLVKYGTIFNK